MVTGYTCRCGNKHIVEDGTKEDTVKKKSSCHRCHAKKLLMRKANRRGKDKQYYFYGTS